LRKPSWPELSHCASSSRAALWLGSAGTDQPPGCGAGARRSLVVRAAEEGEKKAPAPSKPTIGPKRGSMVRTWDRRALLLSARLGCMRRSNTALHCCCQRASRLYVI